MRSFPRKRQLTINTWRHSKDNTPCLSFFFCPLCCLFFDLRILINRLVSSNSYILTIYTCAYPRILVEFVFRCFLPSFSSFGLGVSEEKIKMWKVNRRQTTDDARRTPSDGKSSHCLWQGVCPFCPFSLCLCIVCPSSIYVSDYPFVIFKLF
jgi:hypothetical protein